MPYLQLSPRQRDRLANPEKYIRQTLARQAKEKEKELTDQQEYEAIVARWWNKVREAEALPLDWWDDEDVKQNLPQRNTDVAETPRPPELTIEPETEAEPEQEIYEVRAAGHWFDPPPPASVKLVLVAAHWGNGNQKRRPRRPRKHRGATGPIIRLEITTILGGKTHERTRQ